MSVLLPSAIGLAVVALAVYFGWSLFEGGTLATSYKFGGAHVFITGASEGIGFQLCVALGRRKVKTLSLFSRTQKKMDVAKAKLERKFGPDINVHTFTGDASDPDQVERAVKSAVKKGGHIDVAIAAAGVATPKYFEDLTPADFALSSNVNYLGTVHLALSYLGKAYPITQTSAKRRFMAVSSVAASVPFIGYASYAPTKVAVRAFCDVLRNEFADISERVSIHICFPPDTDTEGFRKENETKPIECKKVWPDMFNEVFTADSVAESILCGIQNGCYHCHSPDTFGNLLVSRGWGAYPRNWLLVECLLGGLFVLLQEAMVWMMDRCVRKYRHHHLMNRCDSHKKPI